MGDRVTETLWAGHAGHNTALRPTQVGTEGLGAVRGHLWVALLQTPQGSPGVPRGGLRTIRQWAAGMESLDTQGTPCWLLLAQEKQP